MTWKHTDLFQLQHKLQCRCDSLLVFSNFKSSTFEFHQYRSSLLHPHEPVKIPLALLSEPVLYQIMCSTQVRCCNMDVFPPRLGLRTGINWLKIQLQHSEHQWSLICVRAVTGLVGALSPFQ